MTQKKKKKMLQLLPPMMSLVILSPLPSHSFFVVVAVCLNTMTQWMLFELPKMDEYLRSGERLSLVFV